MLIFLSPKNIYFTVNDKMLRSNKIAAVSSILFNYHELPVAGQGEH